MAHSERRMLGGAGVLRGPAPNAQFNSVAELFSLSLPLLAKSVQQDNIKNENGLNRRLARFVSSVADKNGLPFIAQPESMEDETSGSSPATDIGIHLKVDDIESDPPKITVFEGKRLSTKLPKHRRKEYVFGHDKDGKHVKCGGIERFKLSIHAKEFKYAGMIGYIQDGIPENWRTQVNACIAELSCQQHNPSWAVQEQLTSLATNERVSESSSVVSRVDGNLYLTHLWIDLGQED